MSNDDALHVRGHLSGLRVELTDWLLGDEARALHSAALLGALCKRLLAGGIPLWRGHLGSRTMHPEVFVRFYDWFEGDEQASEKMLPHTIVGTDTVTKSPVAALSASGDRSLRVRLERARDEIPFPMLQELRDQGATDYLCVDLNGGNPGPRRAGTNGQGSNGQGSNGQGSNGQGSNGQGSMASWTTRRAGGFSDDEIALLEDIVPALRVRVELASSRFAMASLLRTYLGQNAARRVIAGDFRRGSGEVVDAAIWMSDLRDFTRRVDTSALPAVLDALNTYFTCVGDTIIEHGGEILKFIGDAVLAVFPLESDARAACGRALNSAEQALQRMEAANARRVSDGLDELAFGVVLHRGDVMYGNIGATERLDFTVIGKAVNEASRVESLCKPLGTPLLFTEAFASVAQDARAVSLGRHELRGVKDAPEIFTHAELLQRP